MRTQTLPAHKMRMHHMRAHTPPAYAPHFPENAGPGDRLTRIFRGNAGAGFRGKCARAGFRGSAGAGPAGWRGRAGPRPAGPSPRPPRRHARRSAPPGSAPPRPGRGRLPGPGADPTGQDHAGHAPVAGRARHPGDHLAPQRLLVEGALTGDHQVGLVQRGVQAGQPADQADAGLAAGRRGARIAAPRPPAAPAPGSSARPGGQPGSVPLQHLREPRQRGVEQQHVVRRSRPSAARRPRWRRAGRVSGLSTSVAATSCAPRSRGTPPSAGARRASAAPPYGRAYPAASSGAAPSAASRPAPPSLVPEPPSPITTAPRAGLHRGRDQHAQPVRGGGLRVPLGRRRAGAGRTPGRSPGRRCRRRGAPRRRPGGPAGRPSAPAAAARRAPRPAPRRSPARRRPAAGSPARPPGAAARQPAAIASAASTAVSVPANLSGQISTRMASGVCQLTPAGAVTAAMHGTMRA